MSQKIEMTVSPEGATIVAVEGVKGAGCTQLTASLEAMLGDVTALTIKGEYYEDATVVNTTINV